MNNMRRGDRAVEQLPDILAILEACKVCRLAMADEGRPYIVPMNFGYGMEEGALHLYLHCAGEGRKLDILRRNPAVCFEVDCEHALIEADEACGYGYAYASVIGEGRVTFVDDSPRKRMALDTLMAHQTGRSGFTYADAQLAAVEVLDVVVETVSGKRRAMPGSRS